MNMQKQGLKGGGEIAGTLDAFILRAESLVAHQIQLTEKRLSLELDQQNKRSSLGSLAGAKTPGPGTTRCRERLSGASEDRENRAESDSLTGRPIVRMQDIELLQEVQTIVHREGVEEGELVKASLTNKEVVGKDLRVRRQNKDTVVTHSPATRPKRKRNAGGRESPGTNTRPHNPKVKRAKQQKPIREDQVDQRVEQGEQRQIDLTTLGSQEIEEGTAEIGQSGVWEANIQVLLDQVFKPLMAKLEMLELKVDKLMNCYKETKQGPEVVQWSKEGKYGLSEGGGTVRNCQVEQVRECMVRWDEGGESPNVRGVKDQGVVEIGARGVSQVGQGGGQGEKRDSSLASMRAVEMSSPQEVKGICKEDERSGGHGLDLTCLDLPPAASPYTMVMVGVPPLKGSSVETTETLINKAVHWLNKNAGLSISDHRHVLMARRVAWVGKGMKVFDGDCVVVNLRYPRLAQFLLHTFENSPWDKWSRIGLVPLGFFYRQSHRANKTMDWIMSRGAQQNEGAFGATVPVGPNRYAPLARGRTLSEID